ncbi:MAG TPA: hypothetical protein VM425_06575 [Myxococcota bacterium]|nr:hypothetical protein [Myxococcota bacterium]
MLYKIAACFTLAAAFCGCGEGNATAVLTLVAGQDHFPCLGVRRLKITAFRNEVDGRSAEVFGEYYDIDGGCNLPAGLPLEIADLPYGSRMWVQVEGFDSSNRRRMCMGQTEVLLADEIKGGDLGRLTIERERIAGGYAVGTLVISALPGIDGLGQIDELVFNVNYGTPDKINGSFALEPGKHWDEMKFVLSNMLQRLDNKIMIVAYTGNSPLATWEQTGFDIAEGQMFIDLSPEFKN